VICYSKYEKAVCCVVWMVRFSEIELFRKSETQNILHICILYVNVLRLRIYNPTDIMYLLCLIYLFVVSYFCDDSCKLSVFVCCL
jgi:hypothetical protein